VLALSLLTHGLLDAATTIRGNGIELLWPFSEERWRLGWFELRGLSLDGSLSQVVSNTIAVFVTEATLCLPLLLLAGYFHYSQRRFGTSLSAKI